MGAGSENHILTYIVAEIQQKEETTMNRKTEATMGILAALLVLFSAMLDPRISAGLACVLLVAFSIYKFTYKPE
jgi:hypothetical protein